MIKKWDIASDQIKKNCIDEVLARIDEQEGSEFGIIAAQEIIDIVAQHLGPEIYNSAVEDAKKHIKTTLTDLEIELEVLKVQS